MPRSVAELLPSIPPATSASMGLATAAQITTLEALDTDDAGATFNPLAIDLSATRAYDDYVQLGAIQLALSGVTHVPGATATVRVTGNGAAVTVDGVTVFWADGEAGAKTWSDQRTLALWYHPGLGAALAIVPGDGGGAMTASQILAALITVDGSGSTLDADLVDGQHASALLDRANHTGTQAISTVTGLQTALDAKAPKYLSEEFEFPEEKTYSFVGYCPFAGTITALRHFTISGTCTAQITINGVNVTGLSAVALSATPGNTAATANNVISVGNRVDVTFTNVVAGAPVRANLVLLIS